MHRHTSNFTSPFSTCVGREEEVRKGEEEGGGRGGREGGRRKWRRGRRQGGRKKVVVG